MRVPIALLGIPVDSLTMPQAVERTLQLVHQHRRDNQPAYVATANVDFLVQLYSWAAGDVRTPLLREVLRSAEMVTADGMPLVWLSRWLQCPLPERLAGASFLPYLAQECSKQGLSLFLLGGDPATSQRAVDRLRDRYSGLRIVGSMTPTIEISNAYTSADREVDDLILDALQRTQPDILWIGLGCPKQELWFQRVRDRMHVPVSIGVGGTFKFLAGDVRRAPEWMQQAGWEWLYRWVQEPRALSRRYARDLIEFPLLTASLMRSRPMRTQSLSPTTEEGYMARDSVGTMLLKLPSHLERSSAGVFEKCLAAGKPSDKVILDFSSTQSADAYGLGLLLEWSRLRPARPVLSQGIQCEFTEYLRSNHMWDLFQPVYDRALGQKPVAE